VAGRARWIVGTASLAAALLITGSSQALADHPLEPDLVTLPVEDIDLDVYKKSKSRTILRITNEVGNQGAGPLEVRPSDAPAPACDDPSTPYDEYAAQQRIYEDSEPLDGFFERGVDTAFSSSEIGCLVYHDHPQHNHWHVLDFSKYTLRSEKTGKLADSNKAGFCLLDGGEPFDFEVPGKPDSGYFPPLGAACSFGEPDDPPGVMGISVGWSDIYGMTTPGQKIRVDGLREGRYCLTSEADPGGNIIETDDANNADDVRIQLKPKEFKVRELSGPCKAA
jgi:hypothetical protein